MTFSRVDPLLTLADYGLSLVDVPLAEATEIRSRRVFWMRRWWPRSRNAYPRRSHDNLSSQYLETNSRETPYSMVTAVNPEAAPFLGESLGSDEVVITQWLWTIWRRKLEILWT